jgi:putative nucleotidyltransferase with HDIG domain
MASDEIATMLSESITDLPSLSLVLSKLSRITANPTSSAQQVADIVKLDPALTAKVLRLANSAYFGIPRTIDSLKNAVVLLGQKRVYSLALTSGMLQVLSKKEALPFSHKDFWHHSVAVGMIAEAISKNLRRRDYADSDESFTAGLLHDIGKLALGCFGADYFNQATRESREWNVPFFKGEHAKTSHTTVGLFLAKKWNFPEDLCNALAYHHHIARCPGAKRMVAIVHISDGIAHIVNISTTPGETPPQLEPEAIGLVDVQPERLRAIAGEALQNEKRIEAMIECIV